MTYSYIVDCRRGIDDRDLAKVAALVEQGRSVVFPTDTVYGIGATPHLPQGINALQRLKGRGADKPPPVLVPSKDYLKLLGQTLSDSAIRLAASLWPGALTLVVRASPDLHWDLGSTHGTVALRMPASPIALDLLQRTGPLATTSANMTGKPAAVRVDEAIKSFGSRVTAYVDGGQTQGNLPSSIVDVTVDPPRLLRLGVIPLEELCEGAGVSIDDSALLTTPLRGSSSQ